MERLGVKLYSDKEDNEGNIISNEYQIVDAASQQVEAQHEKHV